MSGDDEWIARVLDGETSEAERADFARRLKSEPVLRSDWAAQATLDGWLSVALEAPAQREAQVAGIVRRVRESDRESFVADVRDRVVVIRWRKRVLALAAVAVLAFLAVFSWNRFQGGRVVASIERQESVRWSDTVDAGKPLTAGSRLRLESGLLELRIADKGRMVLEGPADLEFVSASHSILHQGRVVMRVTEAGHGYRLGTPGGSVVDLGTEFGVSVGESGSVETQVIEGQVEATPSGGQKVILNKDDGLRFANGASQRIISETGSFYTELPPRHAGQPAWVHWSFDAGTSSRMEASTEGFEKKGPFAMNLLGEAPGAMPLKSPGVVGDGLSFDGKGSYAESEFRGIGGKAPRTVSFWVKVPVEFSLTEGFGILSWGRFASDDPGGTWQISVNPVAEEGLIGRLRVGTHGGQVIGSTDLRDGRWHHVAVVLYPGSHPDVGKHVLLYVDGRLDEVSQRALREIDTEIVNADHGVWLGRNVSYTAQSVNHLNGGFFRGSLDEVFIFGAALSSTEVRTLMETNQVPR